MSTTPTRTWGPGVPVVALKPSLPSLVVVDVRSTDGRPPPPVPVPLESLWLLTPRGATAVRVRFKYPRSIRAAIAAADQLPRLLLPSFRETTRFAAPLPCCECTCCDALRMSCFAHWRGSLSHDGSRIMCTSTQCPVKKVNLSTHLDLCVSSVTQKISQKRRGVVTRHGRSGKVRRIRCLSTKNQREGCIDQTKR